VDFDRLRTLPPFAQVDRGVLDRVGPDIRERTFAPGREIIREGELTSDFFAILSGTVDVVRDARAIAELGPGDFFGESGALDPGPGYALARSATVRARDTVVVAVIPGEAFTHLVASQPSLREIVYDTMSARQQRS